MDKLARMESLWLDPDYDWETGEYDDSWGPEPEEKRSVYENSYINAIKISEV